MGKFSQMELGRRRRARLRYIDQRPNLNDPNGPPAALLGPPSLTRRAGMALLKLPPPPTSGSMARQARVGNWGGEQEHRRRGDVFFSSKHVQKDDETLRKKVQNIQNICRSLCWDCGATTGIIIITVLFRPRRGHEVGGVDSFRGRRGEGVQPPGGRAVIGRRRAAAQAPLDLARALARRAVWISSSMLSVAAKMPRRRGTEMHPSSGLFEPFVALRAARVGWRSAEWSCRSAPGRW